MEIINPEFVPDKGMSREDMKKLQRKIAEKAEFQDRFDFSIDDLDGMKIAGIDQAFTEDKSVSAVVVMEDGGVRETVAAVSELDMPYIPGLLAFREGPSIVKALQKLDTEPDILFLDGSGRLHFREAGIATHIGFIFDKPALGVAKNLLCGQVDYNGEELSEGTKRPVKSSNRVQTLENGELIGYLYQSKQYPGKRKVNPLYVSSGHRISAESTVKAVEQFSQGYKLPEPTRLADRKVGEIKEERDW